MSAKTNVIPLSEILGYSEFNTVTDGIRAQPQPRFYEYTLGDGSKVIVESTAHTVMEGITQFPVAVQARFFQFIIKNRLQRIGRSTVLKEDFFNGQATAYMTRRDSEPNVVDILMTR